MPGVEKEKPHAVARACCGGLLSATAPAWDSSGESLVVACGRHVRLHRVLDARGSVARTRSRILAVHEQEVVGVALVGPVRAISASRDGTLRVLDTDDADCLRTIDIGEPVRDIAAPRFDAEKCDGCVFVACEKRVVAVSIETSERANHHSLVWTTSVSAIACDDGGALIAAIADRILLLALQESTGQLTSIAGESRNARQKNAAVGKGKSRRKCRALVRRSVHLPAPATAVAVSSDGSMIAVGDTMGCIHVYRDVLQWMQRPEDEPESRSRGKSLGIVPSKFHWHSGPVTALEFAADGNLLLSGGTEAVLVLWKMTRSDFGDRSFRPRVGGAIWGLAPSPGDRYYALTCADNAVRVFDALSLSSLSVVQGIAVPSPQTRSVSRQHVLNRSRGVFIVPDPASDGSVIISGTGGAVQVFDVYRGEHVGFFQVVPRNQVFAGGVQSNAKQRIVPVVRRARMNCRGDSMATIDVQQSFSCGRVEEVSEMEMEILRFWHRSADSESLDMVARVESPHGLAGRISAVEYHPYIPMVATASTCGSVKLWRLVDTGVDARKYTWRCEAERQHRGLSCHSISFSDDGSMLAVAAGSTIALLHVNLLPDEVGESGVARDGADDGSVQEGSPSSVSLEFLHTFVHPPAEELVKDVSFVKGDVPVLASITKNGVYVWNVLTKCVWWSLRMVVSGRKLAVDPYSSRFAVSVDLPRVTKVDDSRSKRKREMSESAAVVVIKGNDTTQGNRREGERHVDQGLVVFDATSPVPKCVHRLPQDSQVLELAFVPGPAKILVGDTCTPLLYMDGDLEVHMLPDPETGAMSWVSEMHPDGNAEENTDSPSYQHNRLDALIGADWREKVCEKSDGQCPTRGPGSDLDVGSMLANSFAGETHVLAPITTTAAGAILRLLAAPSLPEYHFDLTAEVETVSDSSNPDLPPERDESSNQNTDEAKRSQNELPWACGRGRRKRMAKFAALFEKHSVS